MSERISSNALIPSPQTPVNVSVSFNFYMDDAVAVSDGQIIWAIHFPQACEMADGKVPDVEDLQPPRPTSLCQGHTETKATEIRPEEKRWDSPGGDLQQRH